MLLLIDGDGVLTDGKLYIDSTGQKMFKAMHSRDIRAIRELVSLGYEVVIITADDWLGMREYAKNVGCQIVVTREKAEWAEARCTPYIAVGDDAWDVKMLQGAKFAYCPADAIPRVRDIRDIHVLKTLGGNGVIAELLDRLKL